MMTAVIFRHDVTQNQVCGRVHEQTWKAKLISALVMDDGSNVDLSVTTMMVVP